MKRPLTGMIAALALYTGTAWADDGRVWEIGGNHIVIEDVAAPANGDREGSQRLVVRRDGRDIVSIDDFRLHPREPVGANITGGTTPQLVVTGWSGGAHCCYTLHIVELGATPQVIQKIDAGHSDVDLFAQLDEDPALEISLPDWTYAYWPYSFAGSPVPRVILHWDGRQFSPAAKLMRNAAPLSQLRDRRQPQTPQESIAAIFQDALDMIYAGRLVESRTLLKVLLPDTAEAKALRKAFYDCKLPSSPWWSFVARLNNVPATPAKQCPTAESG